MTTPREGIIRLLQNSQNISLLDVVRDQYFQPAVQNSVPEIFDFIFSPQNITLILDIILTAKPPSEFYIISDNGNTQNRSIPTAQELKGMIDILTKIITAKVGVIKSIVVKNENICDYLNRFINTSIVSTDRKISGFFTKIVKHLIYETNGEYINKMPGLFGFLIDRVYILSYGKLLKSILRKFPDKFELPVDKMIDQVIFNAVNDKQKTFFCLMIIKSLLKKQVYIHQFINPIARLDIVKKLILIASNTNSFFKTETVNNYNAIKTENQATPHFTATTDLNLVEGDQASKEILPESKSKMEITNKTEANLASASNIEIELNSNLEIDSPNSDLVELPKSEPVQNSIKSPIAEQESSIAEYINLNENSGPNLKLEQKPKLEKNFSQNEPDLANQSTIDQRFNLTCTCMAAEILKIISTNINEVTNNSEKSCIKNEIEESGPLFSTITNPNDPRLCSLIFVYEGLLTQTFTNPSNPNQNISLIDSFFRGKTSTFVSNSILDYIRNLSDEKFKDFIDDDNIDIVNRIINHDRNQISKANGYITELTKILNDRKDLAPKILSSPLWEKYRNDVFLPHIQLVTAMYGGGYPENYEDSDSDDENLSNSSQNHEKHLNSKYIQKINALNNIDFNYSNPSFTNPPALIGNFPTQTVIGSGAFRRTEPINPDSDNEYSGSPSGSESGSDEENDENNETNTNEINDINEENNMNEARGANETISMNETSNTNEASSMDETSKTDIEKDNKNETIDNKNLIDFQSIINMNNGNMIDKGKKEIIKFDLLKDENDIPAPIRRRKRGTFPSNQPNAQSFLPTFQNYSDEGKFNTIINSNDDTEEDDGDKIEDEKGEAPSLYGQKSNSWDPRFNNAKWSGISNNTNNSDPSDTPSPLSRPHSMGFCSSFNSAPMKNDFDYINNINAQSSDDKLNNDQIPPFSIGPASMIQPGFTRNRNTRRRVGNSVSIDDVPPSLRKIPSNNTVTTNGQFNAPK
ncbi:hypothetical protein M9Y10_009364 [Tritrichomonas musculus]|uniref:Serine/threonine-protein phosphatase 4 regulatory subunit 3-like central domain-containing protein n=1 Tax=Tritrichomonas musculus TaxID=1915356 RepID=A0ABR2IN55_9EUKA